MARIIAVSGKGGTGKTVIAAMMIRHLKKRGQGPILAVDADPDANLGCVMGLPPAKTIADLREETLKEIKNMPAGMSKDAYLEAGLHQIVVEGDGGVDLLSMGHGEGPGCYCYVNNALRKFSEKLQSSYKWVVADNQAGLEHLNRQTTSNIDFLTVVITKNPLSIDCAARIGKVVSEIRKDVKHRFLVVNDVGGESEARAVLRQASHLKMEYVGFVPHDDALEEAVQRRRPLLELDVGKAVKKTGEIVDRILKEAGA